MGYSIVSIASLLITLVLNYDIFFRPKEKDALFFVKPYKVMILSILLFLFVDSFWGFVYDSKSEIGSTIAGVAFFVAEAFAVLCIASFTSSYTKLSGKPRTILFIVGIAFFVIALAIIVVNFFYPILFRFEEGTVFRSGIARYAFYTGELIIFAIAGSFALAAGIKADGKQRIRYIAIASTSYVLAVFIFLQTTFALYPFLSLGFLGTIAVIHTFVIGVERMIYREKLVAAKIKEAEQQKELDWSHHLTYTDSLTGVNSRHAYVEKEEAIDLAIRNGEIEDFAIVVLDLNNLKAINDSFGHEAGDKYIIRSVKLMQQYFGGAPLYRFGGDEFVAILVDENYKNRDNLLRIFEDMIETNQTIGKPIIATGMSTFDKETDNTFRAVFQRADKAMYQRKAELKAKK